MLRLAAAAAIWCCLLFGKCACFMAGCNTNDISVEEDGLVTKCLFGMWIPIKAVEEWGSNEAAVICRDAGECDGDACNNAVGGSGPQSDFTNTKSPCTINVKCDNPDYEDIGDCPMALDLTPVTDDPDNLILYTVTCNPTTQISTNPGTLPTCPEGWIPYENDAKCIKFLLDRKNWFEALADCAKQPGLNPNLVCIQTEDELNFIRDKIMGDPELSKQKRLWTAANRLETGEWHYANTGEPANFDGWGWGTNEPNGYAYGGKRHEDCVNLVVNRGHKMNDSRCKLKALPICQIEMGV